MSQALLSVPNTIVSDPDQVKTVFGQCSSTRDLWMFTYRIDPSRWTGEESDSVWDTYIKREAELVSKGDPTVLSLMIAWRDARNDPATHLYEWAVKNLNAGEFSPVNEKKIAGGISASVSDVQKALSRLVADGDLLVEQGKRFPLYKLVIKYPDL